MERKSPTMIDKLLLQLDGSLGGMNVDSNVIQCPLTGSQPMPSEEGEQRQVHHDPGDDF